jgi:FRG domain-containing protein
MRDVVKWPEVLSRARRWKFDPAAWYEYTYVDGAFNGLVETQLAESWDDFLAWSSTYHDWGFRGQRQASWTLQASLERDSAHGGIRVTYSYGSASGSRYPDRRVIEEKLLSGFRRLARSHRQKLPEDNDLASWLALMQHYGGPTRLLDWTMCPFVGMYFALQREPEVGSRSALWALDLKWLEQRAREPIAPEEAKLPLNGLAGITYPNALLGQNRKPLVVRIDPYYTNERMLAQKGFFLWKMYDETPLFDHMLTHMMIHPEIVESAVIRKLEISPELRSQFLDRLSQEKNIHEASLFPGNDFCEPLRLELQAEVECARTEYEGELRSIQEGEDARGEIDEINEEVVASGDFLKPGT